MDEAAGATITITPYLCVHDANDFYREAFVATEMLRRGTIRGRGVGQAGGSYPAGSETDLYSRYVERPSGPSSRPRPLSL